MAGVQVTVSRPYMGQGDVELRDVYLLGEKVGTIRRTAFTGQKWVAELSVPASPEYPDGRRSYAARRLEDVLNFARAFTGYPVRRFVAMSGEHGCLPDYSGCCDTRESAVEDLVEVFELGGRRSRELSRSDYLELSSRRDGAEYCEVLPCSCESCAGFTLGDLRGESDEEFTCMGCEVGL